jgi:hypothetical protein
MRPARTAALLIVAAALALWPARAAAQPLSLYDDFSSGEIDPMRWLGYTHSVHSTRNIAKPFWNGRRDDIGSDVYSTLNEESTRKVVDGRAQITLTALGPDNRDGDFTPGFSRSGLRLNRAALADGSPAVLRMQATVTVAAVSVDPCAAGTMGGGASFGAQIFGHFFNDGSSRGPGDLTGDVFATLQQSLGSSGAFVASLGRCLSADCAWIERLAAVGFTRAAPVGAAHTLTITWQPAVNSFLFVVGGAGPLESHRIAYTQADATPARGFAYDLRVVNTPSVCYGPPAIRHRGRATIDVRFDDVRLDSAAVTATR